MSLPLQFLKSCRDRLVLAGGFAVNHHGYTRNTLDLDFVCDENDLPDIAWLSLLNQLNPENDLKPLCLQYGTLKLYHEISDLIRALAAK